MLYRVSSLFFRDEKKRTFAHQFMSFAIIGVGNTIIDFGIYTLLTRYTSVFSYHTSGKYFANVISFTIATTFSFYCNHTWTFRRTRRPPLAEIVMFYSTTMSGLVVNTGILFVLSSYFAVNDLIAKAFGTLFSMTWNFFLKKFWVFSKDEHRGAELVKA